MPSPTETRAESPVTIAGTDANRKIEPADDAQGIVVERYTRAPEKVATPWQWRPLTLVAAFAVGTLLLLLVLTYLARSVQIAVKPEPDLLAIEDGLSLHLRDGFLLFPGQYRVHAEREGYKPLRTTIDVSSDASQRIELVMEKLPGLVSIKTRPDKATLSLDRRSRVVTTPVTDLALAPGEHEVRIEAPRYLPFVTKFVVEGMNKKQTEEFSLTPAWAEIEMSTDPPGAAVLLGEAVLATLPSTVEVPMGDQRLVVKLKGYRSVEVPLQVEPSVGQKIPTIQLERADGVVMLRTNPTDASIDVDGSARGHSPLALNLRPGRTYRISVTKPGYNTATRAVTPLAEDETTLSIDLSEQLGDVRISVSPADSEIVVDGQARGQGDQLLKLSTVPHTVEVRRDGYVAQRSQITPRAGFEQLVSANLLTVEQARVAAVTQETVSPSGVRMKLIFPKSYLMGASRREPGRRSNETQRQVTLTHPYYLSALEIDNALFRQFKPDHDSGKFEHVDINGDRQPVSRVSWLEAAAFCNWLSDREKLQPYYRLVQDKYDGSDAKADGYRLPTEAEWEYAARVSGNTVLRFPWGATLPPPDRSGNYADRTAAALIGRIILNYTDGFIGASPVGQFPPNQFGLFDMGGNVAEWVNDFYEVPSEAPVTDPIGPKSGDFHVIRGASWRSGTVADLRLSFRDYAADGRQDVGFRVARSQR